jgi:transcription antitermination factor NusG
MDGGSVAGVARWHAVRVTAGRERAVAKLLERAGVLLYLPLVDRVIVVKSARGLYKRVMQWPMIAGYVFVYSLGLTSWEFTRRTRGVTIEGAQPFLVPDAFIRRILELEIDSAVAQRVRADQQIAALLPPEPKKKIGRRGKHGWRKRRRK